MVKEFAKHDYMAVILGGSSGLGLASARKLAAHGMGLCIIHRNTRSEMKMVNIAFDELRNSGVPFFSFNIDVLNKEAMQQVMEALKPFKGRVRCLLHSIAKGSLKSIVRDEAQPGLSGEDISLTVDYMALSLYEWTMAFQKENLFANDARVLAFTSEGSKRALPHYAAVSVAKAALESVVRSLALELAPMGIRANCIQAGITATASMMRIQGSDDLLENAANRNPFKRTTLVRDVADAVYLLCKDEAAWINGAVIPVDGGEHIC